LRWAQHTLQQLIFKWQPRQIRETPSFAGEADKDAHLLKKSKGAESKLACLGHLLMDSRHSLVVDAKVTQATGKAEQEAAVALVGADKNNDTRGFMEDMLGMIVTPHVARNDTNRASAIDG
jgi:hypothetical protein